MKQNIGTGDRLLRLILGISLVAWGVGSRSGFTVIGGLFSIYEAVSSWCVFYQLIGRNTCPLPSPRQPNPPFFKPFLLGVTILITAIILNGVASWLGWKTWYQFLENWQIKLSLDNYLYLFMVYPLCLGLVTNYLRSKLPDKSL
jgi:hypothetical protein